MGCAIITASCCVLFVPLILQAVGLFTPKWVSNSACDSIGLVYSCCTGSKNDTCKNTNGGDELDVRALGLHATSFAIMFMALLGCCCGVCCQSEHDDRRGCCSAIGGCFFTLIPVAGLFSVIGCIIVASKFSRDMLGYSFYLCVIAGSLALFLSILICCCACCGGVEDGNASGPLIAHSGDTNYHTENGIWNQTVAVHDQETGRIMVLMRQINFTRIVSSARH